MSRGLGEKLPLNEAFDLEGNLCGLAKWLRILGFDAACPRSAPSWGRIFVTTKRAWARPDNLKVSGGTPLEQLKQVLEQTGIRPDPELFLSRCLVCNALVQPIPTDSAAGKVPDKVFQAVSSFHECPCCGRIYWEGTHPERMLKRLEVYGLHMPSSSPRMWG
jgi:uncharacterized protein